MRVLHIGKFFPPFAGGIEHFLADLLPALQDRGVEVAALVHSNDRRGRLPDGSSRVPVYRAPCYGRLLYAPLSPQFPLWLARVIRRFRPDLLHLHLPNTSAFWTLTLPAARRLPWVLHWHSDVVSSLIDRRLALAYRAYRPFEQALLSRSRAVVVTSPPYLEHSAALGPWRDKCHVIPLGLDPTRTADPSGQDLQWARDRWGPTGLRLLAIGRLTYYKGHDQLIEAVTPLEDVQLRVVGEGERRERLQTLIDRNGLHGRVSLEGFQPEGRLNALLASCDLLCLPSQERTEAFGMVLLEAMRFGKPVIVSDIPGSGAGWVVREGHHGQRVPVNDIPALTQAIRTLARDPARRRRLGENGAGALADTFHISRVGRQVEALYRQLV